MNINTATNEAITLSRHGAAMAVVSCGLTGFEVVPDAEADDPKVIAHNGRIVYKDKGIH